jgi:putative membrane protein
VVVTAIRGALGGVLMGLANLVPGISGGTMLLAAGVYPAFIAAIAELTTLRFRLRSVVLLAVVAAGAVAAILSLAGPTRTLVIEDRWVMYSLFIGLTLGGVPLVWRLARPLSAGLIAGTAVGFALMIVMALSPTGGSAGEGHAYGRLLVAGTAGAAAMILPGVSGGYLLLLLGQYLPILGAVDKLKLVLVAASAGEGIDLPLLSEALHVVVPVGIGVLVGIVGISNLLQWTLDRFPKPTLGLLLGLLLGAVAGLWPFQEGVAPKLGEVFEGGVLNQERLAQIDPEDWPMERFRPDSSQIGGSLLLIGLGLAATLAIDRLGRIRTQGEPATKGG